MRTQPIAPLCLALLLPSAAAGQVLVVDDGGGADFTAIQDAVAAAAEGGTVLVKAGSYDGVAIDGKALTVVAEAGQAVQLGGAVTVTNLAAGQTVVLHGLAASSAPKKLEARLEITDCAGDVWVEDCAFSAAAGFELATSPISPEPVAVVRNSDRVSLTRCTLKGTDGLAGGFSVVHAGGALLAVDSDVALYECDLQGGRGSDAFVNPVDLVFPGGQGGRGAEVQGGALFVSGSSVRGGDGGSGLSFVWSCPAAGDGGDGLLLASGAPQATSLDTLFAGGAAGPSPPSGCSPPGSPGQAVNAQSGAHAPLPGAARALEVGSPVREGELAGVEFSGEPGDLVVALVGSAPDHTLSLPFSGVFLAQLGLVSALGTADAAGSLAVQIPIPPFGSPTLEAADFFVQVVALGAVGGQLQAVLGAPSAMTKLDDQF